MPLSTNINATITDEKITDHERDCLHGVVTVEVGDQIVDVPVAAYYGVPHDADVRGIYHTADFCLGDDGADWDEAHQALNDVASVVGHEFAHKIAIQCGVALMRYAQEELNVPGLAGMSDDEEAFVASLVS